MPPRQPRRPIRKLVDLDRFLNDDAVGAKPSSFSHRHAQGLTIAHIAYIGLRIERERRFLPRIQLGLRHLDEGTLRVWVVWKRIRVIAGVSFTPEAVLHHVNPFDEGFPSNSAASKPLSSLNAI